MSYLQNTKYCNLYAAPVFTFRNYYLLLVICNKVMGYYLLPVISKAAPLSFNFQKTSLKKAVEFRIDASRSELMP
jgi:hypothetical protein